MKTSFIAPIVASISATAATAGSVAFTPAVESIMVEEAPMGSSGAWIIPLIAIGLIAIAVSSSSDEEETSTSTSTSTLTTF